MLVRAAFDQLPDNEEAPYGGTVRSPPTKDPPISLGNLVLCCRSGNQIPRPIVGHAMPRRKRIKLPPRMALPASELEGKIMAMLRGLKECAKLKGVGFVHVGSFGQEPNWFAQPLPSRISDACRRAFVTAFAKVRKEFDLLFPRRLDTDRTSPPPNNGGSRPSV
jgi:hypothetical protein